MTPRRLVTRFYEEVWNRADTSAIPELFHPDCRLRGSLGHEQHGHEQHGHEQHGHERQGHEGLAAYVREVTGALGGFRCDIEALVVEDERAFAKLRFSGRHEGELLGVAPTGREVSWAGAALFECEAGRIRALWVLGDLAGLRAQLGAPADA